MNSHRLSSKVLFIILIACVLLSSLFFIALRIDHDNIPVDIPTEYHQISENVQSTDENINAIELSNKIILSSDSKEPTEIKILNPKYETYQINHYNNNGDLIGTKTVSAEELSNLLIINWSTYEIIGIENITYGDGWTHYNYSDGHQEHKLAPSNYLRWDGEWRPKLEMIFSSGDWSYLVEDLGTYYLVTRLDDSLNLSKIHRTYDFQPYKIGVTLTLTPTQLNGLSTPAGDYWYITISQSLKETAKHLNWDNKLPIISNEFGTILNQSDNISGEWIPNYKYQPVGGELRLYYNRVARSFGIASTEITFNFNSYIINGSTSPPWQNTSFDNTINNPNDGRIELDLEVDGYISRWNMGVKDWNRSSANDLDLYLGAVWDATGLHVDGINDYARTSGNVITSDKYTIISTINSTRTINTGINGYFFSRGDGDADQYDSVGYWGNASPVNINRYFAWNGATQIGSGNLTTYTEYQSIYIRYNTSYVEGYINNTLNFSGNLIKTYDSGILFFGIRSDLLWPFQGNIKKVLVYETNLSTSERQNVYNFKNTGNITHWHDAGTGYQTASFIVNMTTPTNTNYTIWYADNGSSFSQIGGTYTGNQTPLISGTKYQNTDLRIIMNGNSTATPEEIEITFVTEASVVAPTIILLSQTPSIIYKNSTGYLNISYGITHSSTGLNNTSVSFIYRNYDYDLSDSNHSIRPPTNDLASVWNFNGKILRAANRNETPGLNFENNDTITGGDTYTWSGLDENSTKLTIVPVNSTYTKIYINATVHCIMPQMWYLDRTDQQQATKTQLAIHKTQNVLIKFWNFEIFKGNTDFLGVGYTDTLLDNNPALWPSDANPVNFYYVNSSYDPATGGDPITSGYAVYMGSLNASGWVDHVYSRSNSNYVRGFIDNTYLNTIVDTTSISHLYFTSNTESSRPFYINMTNVASSTNVSFADTNTLWAGNTPPYTPQAYTPNVWFAFMKLNMSLDHKLYAADNNDLWGVSSMNRTNITQALFPPTTPVIDHFHFLGETDYDMDGVYYDNFSIGCGVSTDPDGGDVTHNLTLHYANNLTFVTIINNAFTDKDITHNGVYFDANFSSSPYYSDDVNYTLRLIATDDESETVTVWLGVNFTLSITPVITSYTPSTPVTTIQHDTQEFTINISQIVNVTWYIDGSVVSIVNNTNYSTYSNSTAPIGTYNVTAYVENVNGTRQQVWEWNVEDPVFAALLQLQADIDKMKKTQTIIQALIFLVIGVVVGVVAQRRRFNDEDSEKPIESKNN